MGKTELEERKLQLTGVTCSQKQLRSKAESTEWELGTGRAGSGLPGMGAEQYPGALHSRRAAHFPLPSLHGGSSTRAIRASHFLSLELPRTMQTKPAFPTAPTEPCGNQGPVWVAAAGEAAQTRGARRSCPHREWENLPFKGTRSFPLASLLLIKISEVALKRNNTQLALLHQEDIVSCRHTRRPAPARGRAARHSGMLREGSGTGGVRKGLDGQSPT